METILSIAGKPGLYKLVSRSKGTFIVEMLDESHKRMPVFATDRVTSLADVAMYTDADEVPLWQVLESVGVKEEKLPDFDRDRVHDSDIKKLLQWYNILVKAGITEFQDALAPTEGDNVADRA